MTAGRWLLLLGTLLTAPAARAQTTGAMQARITVVRALMVTALGNLAFGTVPPTTTKTVAPAAGGAFRIRGATGQGITVTFAFPSDMGSPALALGAWTGLVNTKNRVGTAAAFTPTAPLTQTLSANNGRLFIWLGATLTAVSATAGNYSVPVTLTVVYN